MSRLTIFILLIISLFSCKKENTVQENSQLASSDFSISLQQLSPEQTGIDFNNTLSDTGNLNIFVWNFLYTGAGVATGDINNDGLPDIYFAGNQVRDRLYLNKGDFKFDDITESAGIPDDKTWTTGVSMADVNADGLLDIYVCKNSPTPNRNANRNKLFINLGNNRFADQATEYGLADEGFSIQASFFDPDQDGDLDMFLANQPFDQLARFIHPPEVVKAYPMTDRFFENDNGRFIDRTAEMQMADDRYGLGISLGDYDGNGWTDIYLCNDYAQADKLYMNYEGKFKDEIRERTGHTSFYSMGSDAGDVNNDGWEDVFVLDMAFEDHYRAKTNMESMQPELFQDIVSQGHHYPYAQNTLQLNRGDGYFTEVAQIGGMSKSDWSWATLLADLDQDGLQDVLITNGILRDMKNNDFAQWVKQTYQGRVGPTNYLEVLRHLPSNPVKNKIYRNIDGLHYRDISKEVDFGDPGFSHGLAYADFDGDGALDLVVNNMNAPADIFKNNSKERGNYFIVALEGQGKNTHGLGTSVMLCAGGKCTARTMQTTRGYYSSCVPELHFGIGTASVIDSLIVYWNAKAMSVFTKLDANQKYAVSYTKVKKVPRKPRSSENLFLTNAVALPHVHHETSFDDYKDQVLLPYKLSQNGPFIAQGDIDGDNLVDLFVGGGVGQAGLILRQTKDGSFINTNQPALTTDAAYEDMEAVFFDVDSDNDQDLYVVSGSNEFPEGHPMLEDRMYINDGTGNFTRHRAALPDALRINGQCVEAFDIEGDGDMDLFIGGRLKAGAYPVPASSALLVNEKGILKAPTTELAPFLFDLGLVTDAISDDVDGDGDMDLIVVGEWMAPLIMINDKGRFSSFTLESPGVGLWWTIEKGDFDQDGDSDFLLGNLGWNNKFGGETPKLAVYAADFDNNGNHDVVLSKKVGDKELPVRGRECSSQELPFIASKFPTYDAFARAPLAEIYGETELNKSVHVVLETMSSVYLRNDGGLKFTMSVLPHQVQTGPVKAFYTQDFNHDGNLDFIFIGNHFPVEVETARYDGLLHGICFGDGKGDFQTKILSSVDFPLMGDYRDIYAFEASDKGFRLILSQNNGTTMEYRVLPN